MHINVRDRHICDCAPFEKIVNIIDHEMFATYGTLDRAHTYVHQFSANRSCKLLDVHTYTCVYEVRASQLAQASEKVGSPIPASQQG